MILNKTNLSIEPSYAQLETIVAFLENSTRKTNRCLTLLSAADPGYPEVFPADAILDSDGQARTYVVTLADGSVHYITSDSENIYLDGIQFARYFSNDVDVTVRYSDDETVLDNCYSVADFLQREVNGNQLLINVVQSMLAGTYTPADLRLQIQNTELNPDDVALFETIITYATTSDLSSIISIIQQSLTAITEASSGDEIIDWAITDYSISSVYSSAWEVVATTVAQALPLIAAIVNPLLGFITGAVVMTFNAIKSAFTGQSDAAQGNINPDADNFYFSAPVYWKNVTSGRITDLIPVGSTLVYNMSAGSTVQYQWTSADSDSLYNALKAGTVFKIIHSSYDAFIWKTSDGFKYIELLKTTSNAGTGGSVVSVDASGGVSIIVAPNTYNRDMLNSNDYLTTVNVVSQLRISMMSYVAEKLLLTARGDSGGASYAVSDSDAFKSDELYTILGGSSDIESIFSAFATISSDPSRLLQNFKDLLIILKGPDDADIYHVYYSDAHSETDVLILSTFIAPPYNDANGGNQYSDFYNMTVDLLSQQLTAPNTPAPVPNMVIRWPVSSDAPTNPVRSYRVQLPTVSIGSIRNAAIIGAAVIATATATALITKVTVRKVVSRVISRRQTAYLAAQQAYIADPNAATAKTLSHTLAKLNRAQALLGYNGSAAFLTTQNQNSSILSGVANLNSEQILALLTEIRNLIS